MNQELKIILVKFTLITIGLIVYTLIAMFYIGPMIYDQIAFGQSAFDATNQFQQQFPQQQQYQQPYVDPYSQQQFQYQQPYGMQQYGSPYGMQQPYGYPQPQNPIQFGTSEIIYTILGGGAIGYARYNQTKRNQDKEIQREQMAFQLKTMEAQKELARVTYQMNQEKANQINDAPSVQLNTLEKSVDEFRDKVAKA